VYQIWRNNVDQRAETPKLWPKIKIQNGGCPPSWISENVISEQWVIRKLIFRLRTTFSAKNVDRRPNYGPKSK